MNQHAPDLFKKKTLKSGLKDNPRKDQYVKYLGDNVNEGLGAILKKSKFVRPKSGSNRLNIKTQSRLRNQPNCWEQVQSI